MAMFDTVKVLINDKGLAAGIYQTYDLGQRGTTYAINKSGFLDYVDIEGHSLTTQEGTYGIGLYNIETDVTECVHFVNGMISRLISDEEVKSIWELEAPQRELETRRMSLQLRLNSLKHIGHSATPMLTVSDANEPGIAIAPYHLIGFGQPSKSYSMDAEGVTNICDDGGVPYTSGPGEFILLTNTASGLTYFLEMVDGKITKATEVNKADTPERESAINQPIHVSPLGETVDPMSVGLSLMEKYKEHLRDNITRSREGNVITLPVVDGNKLIIGNQMKSVLVKAESDTNSSDIGQAATVIARPLSERVFKARYREICIMDLDDVMEAIGELPNAELLLQKVKNVKEDAAREAVARGVLIDIAEKIFHNDRLEELAVSGELFDPLLGEFMVGKRPVRRSRGIADKTPVDFPELRLAGEPPELRGASTSLMQLPNSESLERARQELEATCAARCKKHLEAERPLMNGIQLQMFNAMMNNADPKMSNHFLRELVKSLAESRTGLYETGIVQLVPNDKPESTLTYECRKWHGFIENMKPLISPLLIEEFKKILAGGNESERERFIVIMQMQATMPKSHTDVIKADISKMLSLYALPSYVKKVFREESDVIDFFADMTIDSMKFSLAIGEFCPLTVIYSVKGDDRNVYFINQTM